MFKKFAAEALGLSDIGVIVAPSDYDKVDADDYLFHEDGEKIFFLIKSKKDEYCFTNLALIHVDGDSAVSSKRAIRRYDFASHVISGVSIETAGTIDLDIELKFRIDDSLDFNIDVRKSHLEQLKDIYKALHTIGKMQSRHAVARDNVLPCLSALASMYKIGSVDSEATLVKHYNALLYTVNSALLERHVKRDFSDVFEKYIQS
ncbi:PH domain-containing protein [Eleftheria terrae]|uniref:PH domain-containing protein n=1 Tax=Eleftheria terrae TaxID=1597781 RepID=UPI00263B167C|nr:PH domain-containing protein [Eleftheria terrae]WKB51537.1 PH domain-containing protein [Eleftheria terrae]